MTKPNGRIKGKVQLSWAVSVQLLDRTLRREKDALDRLAKLHAQLQGFGCDHVQGFGIGRPMPFEKTLEWMKRHNAKLEDTPRIGREAG